MTDEFRTHGDSSAINDDDPLPEADPFAGHQYFEATTTAWQPDRSERKALQAVIYCPKPRKTERGTSYGMRFPVLVVTDLATGPEAIAQKVADILNKHWDEA